MRAIRQRPLWVVFALTLLSFGLYAFAWFGQTWSELKTVAGNPHMRRLAHALSMVIPIFAPFQIADHFRTIREQRERFGLTPSLDSQLALGAFLLAAIAGPAARNGVGPGEWAEITILVAPWVLADIGYLRR